MSRRSRRWDTSIDRQYRAHDRDYKRSFGKHDRWWNEGQEALRWEAYVAKHPEHAGDECPF